MDALRAYQWPGNIRELRNMIERAVLLCADDRLTTEHLPVEKMGAVVARTGPSSTRAVPPPAPSTERARSVTVPAFTAVAVADVERQRVTSALEACAGNQSQAAKVLGISRATLIRRIEEHAIRRPRKKE